MRFIKTILTILVIIVVIVIVIFAVGLWNLKKETYYSAGRIYQNFNYAASALNNLETNKASGSLLLVKKELNKVSGDFSKWSRLLPPLKKFKDKIFQVNQITNASLDLTNQVEFLKINGLQLIIQKKGAVLVEKLKNIQKDLAVIAPAADDEKLYTAQNMLTALLVWLDDNQPKHLAILFQNSSEIRPAGGFIGSFADVTLEKGGLANLEVQDIYDVDGQLTVKVEAPEPLQKVTKYWGARDANWFFDFSTSARKVIEFLGLSKTYQEREIKFSGAIGINYKVIEDLLRVIGPIKVNDFTLDADNFLFEVQKDVETNQNKDILKNFTPLIFEKLNQFSEKEKKDLLEIFKYRLANKDIMIYIDQPLLENYLVGLGAAGEQYAAPQSVSGGFVGDYLAVVNANIGGGKTDAFIEQKIELVSRLSRQEAKNLLTIERKNNGDQREEKWYNTVNRNYLQVFITEPDPLIANWFDAGPGKKSGLQSSYLTKFSQRLEAGSSYTFIFDKQSGVESNLKIILAAPTGMKWQETGTDIFKYKTFNPPARVKIELHLVQ